MRHYLISPDGQFYKANLHTHSTFSDGKKTPHELKEIYKSLGYSILAYTDHEVFIPHSELTDENFLSLHGCEYGVYEDSPDWSTMRMCHFTAIATDPDIINQPFWHRENSKSWRGAEFVKFDESVPDYERVYSTECISEMMRGLREAGFFVIHNHPTRSLERYAEYMSYDGMHALEVFNSGSFTMGAEECNQRIYDDMLIGGKKIYCIGADDSHVRVPLDSPYCDAGKSFTVIKAKSLDYREVTGALLRGDFYASEGPKIHELYCEDGKVHIKTSPVDRIFISSDIRDSGVVFGGDGTLTEASFDIPTKAKYFRLTAIDKFGKRACTNAYFSDDLNLT